jgi:hypothetical protein
VRACVPAVSLIACECLTWPLIALLRPRDMCAQPLRTSADIRLLPVCAACAVLCRAGMTLSLALALVHFVFIGTEWEMASLTTDVALANVARVLAWVRVAHMKRTAC